MSERGERLILCGRDNKRLHAAAQNLAARNNVFLLAADVAKPDFPKKFAALMSKHKLQRLDCVIHNAAINHMGTLAQTKQENAENTFRVNTYSVLHVTSATEPYLSAAGDPRFILVSSLMKYFPMPGRAVYAASKAAAEQFLLAWKLELKARQSPIRVQIFRPAGIETDFHHNTTTDGEAPKSDISRMSAARVARYLADFTQQNRREMAPGYMNKLVAFVARHFPGVTRRILLRRYKKHHRSA